MKIEKFQTVRIKFDNGYYCGITPRAEEEGCYDFWLHNLAKDIAEFMFACNCVDEDEAISLATSNAPSYMEEI